MIKVRASNGDPVTWVRDVWEGPTEAENFEPLDSRGFVSPEEVVSPSSAGILTPPPFSAFD